MDALVPAAEPLAIDPDAALAELLEAIRHGGRCAYRQLLGALRELKAIPSTAPSSTAPRWSSSRARRRSC